MCAELTNAFHGLDAISVFDQRLSCCSQAFKVKSHTRVVKQDLSMWLGNRIDAR